MIVGQQRRLSTKELMFLTCSAGKDLRIPWTARRSNQSMLKEINPKYSLEGLMLKLTLQYFGHLMWRANSLEKDSDAGKDWAQEKGATEDETVEWHHCSMDMNLSKLQEMVKGREAWHAAVHWVAKSRTRLNDWTTTLTRTEWCSSLQTLDLFFQILNLLWGL